MSIDPKFVELTADAADVLEKKLYKISCPFAPYRLYALGSCLGKRVGVR